MRYWRSASTLALAAVVLTLLAAETSATPRHGGHRPAYGPAVGFYGSVFWPGWGFYGPFAPYYGWWAAPYPYAPPQGERVGVRLEVEPPETEVYVDGYRAGVVDEFDGLFQRLQLAPGPHEIELYLDGHQAVRQELYASAGTSYKIRHEMLPLGAGETPSPRPQPREPVEGPSTSVDQGTEAAGPAPKLRAGFGALALQVQPQPKEVLIDGEAWPGVVTGELTVHLPAGRHQVEIRGEGRGSFSTEVEITPGKTTPLNVKLPASE